MMITQTQTIKSENHTSLGAPYMLGKSPSSSSAPFPPPAPVITKVEMPMKKEERLNELESNAVKALLSLGEAFVSQTPYRAAAKKSETISFIRPLQPHQQQQLQNQASRSVIVKAEPILPVPSPIHEESRQPLLQQQRSIPPPPPVVTSTPLLPSGLPQISYARELGPGNNGLNNQQPTIRLASTNAPATSTNQKSSSSTISPVSIQPVVSAVSTSSPVISTIFYQLPGTAVSTANGTNGTVMPPSFTIMPAPNGRTVIPLPMVTTSQASLVKIEPSTVGASLNWSNIQLLKVPRSSVENGNGLATLSTLAPAIATPTTPSKLLPSPIKTEVKPLLPAAPVPDIKSPTKSRARRRSQSTTKGQARNTRVSSSCSSDFMACPSVDGLPSIVVDGYEISREIWAKAFLQNDIIHAAGTLFNALFSSEEIKNCTLNGRNGTRQLCPEKRHAIFKIVAWMKNKCQDPYSFNKSPEDTKVLNREEQMMIEKKVFVERRYQTSRKIRDLPSTSTQPALSSSPQVATTVSTLSVSPVTPSKSSQVSSSKSPISSTSISVQSISTSGTLPTITLPAVISARRDSGSFSTICSPGDDKGIPKIALIQSSEIIANYFQSTEPLPMSTAAKPSLITTLPHDGPPPLKMQKVG